jgi:hypothetical protein
MNPIIQAIFYTVLILSFGCMAFGYWPMLIPGLLWLYLSRYAWREPKRIFNRLLGRWREYRHGAKCYRCDRRTSVWFGAGWLPLCDVHHRELIAVRESYTKSDVSSYGER